VTVLILRFREDIPLHLIEYSTCVKRTFSIQEKEDGERQIYKFKNSKFIHNEEQ
jgi:hypothetical protein